MLISNDRPVHGRGMTKGQVQSLLPKVGDVLMELPTVTVNPETAKPEECTVVEVNTAHLWYRVKFTRTGALECYKVPKYRPGKEHMYL